MKLLKSILTVSLAFFCLTGCGYRFNSYLPTSKICIPFVEGDNEGIFTSTLHLELAKRGGLAPSAGCEEYTLFVCLSPPKDENIGFRYAPGESKILTANETRLSIQATVRLVACATQVCEWGPVDVYASIDYDFESDFSNVNRHRFALGQLEMHELARDAAFPSLYKLLSQKIVDRLSARW